MEDVDSEKQKPLPFHFQTPCLQFTKDESKARIHWQARGNVVANHKQHMVNSVSKENKTSLYSSWMPSAEAKRKHEALLAELRQGTSWLNLYQTTAKVCAPEKPLPHNFAMPMVELHSSDKTLARIHWQQRGAIVAHHAKHLKQYNGKDKKVHEASQYVVVAATARKHEALVILLRNGTSWLNMYQATFKACHELSSSRREEELAEAAKGSRNLEAAFEVSILRQAQEEVNMHGLNFKLSAQELMVPQLAGSSNTFMGLRNMNNTSFVNAILQVFLHVSALRQLVSEANVQQCRDVPSVGRVLGWVSGLRRLQEALQKTLRWHSSSKWSVVAPITVLQAIFDLGVERYGMIAGWPCDAMECLKLFHKALGSPNNEDCWLIEEQLHYPSGIPKDARSEISQVLHQIASSKGAILDNSPKTLVLSILPYMLRTDDSDAEELDGEWVTATFTEWDAAVDLAPFFRNNPPCSEYHVKAVVYHLHPADGPIKTKCGHYVAYVKQAQLWHLANDSSVSAVLMSGLSGVPYVLVLERKDVPGANLVAKQAQQPAA